MAHDPALRVQPEEFARRGVGSARRTMAAMSEIVVNKATLKCTMAMPPGTSTFVVLPTPLVNAGGMPVATIMDNKPMANIPPFGMCQSQLNPGIAAEIIVVAGNDFALGIPLQGDIFAIERQVCIEQAAAVLPFRDDLSRDQTWGGQLETVQVRVVGAWRE